jgi:PAS domain-containing protein
MLQVIGQLGGGLAAIVAAGLIWGRLARQQDTPAARPLFALTLTLIVSAGVFTVLVSPVGETIGEILGLDFPPARLWVLLSFNTTGVVAVLWFVFALRYTGRGRLLSWGVVGCMAALPVGMLALSGLLLTGVIPGNLGANTLERILGILTYTTDALLLVGAVLVVQPSFGERSLPMGQGLSLAGVALFVFAGPVLGQLFFDLPSVFPALLVGSMSCMGICLVRYEPFQALPVARAIERDEIIESFSQAVIVVDNQNQVRDLNAAAAETFGVDRTSTLRRRLGDIIPAFADAGGTDRHIETASGEVLSVETTPVTDSRGSTVGRLLVLRDVTARETRKRRLQVLTAVLAETVCDRMNDVAAMATPLADEDDPPRPTGDVAENIRQRTTGLLRLIGRVRTVERTLDDGTNETSTALEPFVRSAAEAVRSSSRMDVTVDGEGIPAVAVAPPAAEAVCGALIEHAARRAERRVDVSLTTRDGAVRLVVTDDGPTPPSTIDDIELSQSDGVPLPVGLTAVVAAAADGAVSIKKIGGGRRRVVVTLTAADVDGAQVEAGVSA